MKTIEVNLLPGEYIPQSPFSIRNSLFMVFSLLVLIFLAFDLYKISGQEKKFEQHSQNLEKYINIYKEEKNHIQMLKAKTAVLHERSKLVTDVIEQRVTWSDKLSQIYTKVPANVLWLSEMSLERLMTTTATPNKPSSAKAGKDEKSVIQKEQVLLHILGDAKDLSDIAEFIFRLEEIPFLENIQFHSINEREQEGRPVMSFEIIATVNMKSETQL